MKPFFYEPHIEKNRCLSEEDTKHAVKVLRLQARDEIVVVDGHNTLFECTLTHTQGKNAVVDIHKKVEDFGPMKRQVHLAIAPTKNSDRIEWMLEKLAEQGLASCHLVKTEKTIAKSEKIERLLKIAVSAMKQSQQAQLCQIYYHKSLQDFWAIPDAHDKKYICHGHQDALPIKNVRLGSEPIWILVGPEGDFTTSEIENALGMGFEMTSLGQTRLRTETAGLVAATIFLQL